MVKPHGDLILLDEDNGSELNVLLEPKFIEDTVEGLCIIKYKGLSMLPDEIKKEVKEPCCIQYNTWVKGNDPVMRFLCSNKEIRCFKEIRPLGLFLKNKCLEARCMENPETSKDCFKKLGLTRPRILPTYQDPCPGINKDRASSGRMDMIVAFS